MQEKTSTLSAKLVDEGICANEAIALDYISMSDQHEQFAAQTTTNREALARFLMGGSREYQDMGQPYEKLTVHRVRREQPKYGSAIWPEMPMWEWLHGSEALRILQFLGIDPDSPHRADAGNG